MKAIDRAQGYLATNPLWNGVLPVPDNIKTASKRRRDRYYREYFASSLQLNGIGFLAHAFGGHSASTDILKVMESQTRSAFTNDLLLLSSAKGAYEARCISGKDHTGPEDYPYNMGVVVGRGLNASGSITETSNIGMQFSSMSAEELASVYPATRYIGMTGSNW